MKICNLITFLFILLFATAYKGMAQQVDDSEKRIELITEGLGLKDATAKSKLRSVLIHHFDSLHAVFAKRTAAINRAGSLTEENNELSMARSEAAWNAASGSLNKLQATFLGRLSSILKEDQIESVKNLMTENGLNKEYGRFLELLPSLTPYEKKQVMAYLSEARENAMCAETADVRKQWFIKYRGRANNFLAAAGHDLRKATEVLQKNKSEKKN